MSSVIVILYGKDFVIYETDEFELISFYDISFQYICQASSSYFDKYNNGWNLNSYLLMTLVLISEAIISIKTDNWDYKICYNLSDIMSFKMWNGDTLPESKKKRFNGGATKKKIVSMENENYKQGENLTF